MNEETPKHPGGAPTKYRSHFPEQSRKLCLLGATDQELADFFEVHVDSISEWKKVHEEFSEAIRAGRVAADSEIANSLHDRAKGAEWVEQVAIKVKTQTKPGCFTEAVEVVEVTRRAPPDTQAASLWLRNRRPKNWREKVDHEITGKDGLPLPPAAIVNITDELIEKHMKAAEDDF